MGFIKSFSSKVVDWFTPPKEQAVNELARGYPINMPVGMDIYSYSSYSALGQYLQIDTDLLAKYADYESMDEHPEIHAALNVYADDATQVDSQSGHVMWISSPREDIQIELNNLLHRTLQVDAESWEQARIICKYGSAFDEVLVDPEKGVVGLAILPTPTVRRVQGRRGELYGFFQDLRGRFLFTPDQFHVALKDRAEETRPEEDDLRTPLPPFVAFEPWEVVHFRLSGYRYHPYGISVLEGARWIWKRLILIEDAALIYRLERAPERYAFYIDTGDLPPREAMAYLQKTKQLHRKKRFVDPTTGKLNLRYDAIASDENFYIPSKNGQDGTRIEVLQSPVWQSVDDVSYFLDKLFSALGVPKAYLAQDENINRATLSAEDVRFARSVFRVQKALKEGYDRVCRIHLAAKSIDPNEVEYTIHMTVPSSIFELAQMEVYNARADLAGRLRDFVSLPWILTKILRLSDDEAKAIIKQRGVDAVREAKTQAKVAEITMPAEAPAEDSYGEEPEQLEEPMSDEGDIEVPEEAPPPSRYTSSLRYSPKNVTPRYQPTQEAMRRAVDTQRTARILNDSSAMRRQMDGIRSALQEVRQHVRARPPGNRPGRP